MKLLLSSVLATLAAAPAMAAIGSSASLTGLRYELVDLDPGDGVAPSVRYTGVSLAQSDLGTYCGFGCSRSTGSFSEPAFANFTIFSGGASGFAAVTPGGLFASGTNDNSITFQNFHGSGGVLSYTSTALYRAQPGQPLFVLSANTGLRITAQYTLDAWATPWTDAPHHNWVDLTGPEGASASLRFRSPFIEGAAPSLMINAQTSATSPADFQHASGEVSVLLRNDLDHQAVLWGQWSVQARGSVPSVPEPSSWALMLAGMGTVGFMARKRRRPPEHGHDDMPAT